MPNCHEMKVGNVYACEKCGLELKVVKECKEVETAPENCRCIPYTLVCCGEEMKRGVKPYISHSILAGSGCFYIHLNTTKQLLGIIGIIHLVKRNFAYA